MLNHSFAFVGFVACVLSSFVCLLECLSVRACACLRACLFGRLRVGLFVCLFVCSVRLVSLCASLVARWCVCVSFA